MIDKANNIFLSEKISEIKFIDEELKNLVFEKPSFTQPTDSQNKAHKDDFARLKNIDIHTQSEHSSLNIIFGRSLNFYIGGIPVLQWELGHSIGSNLEKSWLSSRKALIGSVESKLKYGAVQLGTKLFEKIKDGINPISQYSSEGVEVNPNVAEYQPPFNVNRSVNNDVGADYTYDEYGNRKKIESENRENPFPRISDSPDRLLGTHFTNDLQKSIAQIEGYSVFGVSFPFYFKNVNNNETCFFTAYFDNISENISANWSKLDFFGRTQGISKYINTNWTISISFNMAVERIEDLSFMYKKLDWLKKMNYPKYNEHNSMAEVPLIKFTIGNLFADLGGYISSLSIDYDMAADWEMKNGKQLPRKAVVNLDFNIIKEKMPSSETTFFDHIAYDESLQYYKS